MLFVLCLKPQSAIFQPDGLLTYQAGYKTLGFTISFCLIFGFADIENRNFPKQMNDKPCLTADSKDRFNKTYNSGDFYSSKTIVSNYKSAFFPPYFDFTLYHRQKPKGTSDLKVGIVEVYIYNTVALHMNAKSYRNGISHHA